MYDMRLVCLYFERESFPFTCLHVIPRYLLLLLLGCCCIVSILWLYNGSSYFLTSPTSPRTENTANLYSVNHQDNPDESISPNVIIVPTKSEKTFEKTSGKKLRKKTSDKSGRISAEDVENLEEEDLYCPSVRVNDASPAAPSGRDPAVGDVATLRYGPYNIFLWSAFWDDRPELESDPVVRVLIMITAKAIEWTKLEPNLRCVLWYDGRVVLNSSIADHAAIAPSFQVIDNNLFDRHVITCQGPDGGKIPAKVTLEWCRKRVPGDGPIGNTDTKIPVERPEKTNERQQLVTCMSTLFGNIIAQELVEWFEIQKILGVNKAILYKDRVNAAASQVLKHYEEEGFLQVWQMNCTNTVRNYGVAWQHVSVTDCLYRQMHLYDRLMFIDTDEMIVPSTTDSLPEMVRQLDRNQRQSSQTGRRGANYVFLGGNFLLNEGNRTYGTSYPDSSIFLNYHKRMPPVTYYHKPIINPRSCVTTIQHHCTHMLPLYRTNYRHEVDPAVGYVHHYRKSLQVQVTLDFRGYNPIQDETIMRFAESLASNLQRKLKLLGLDKKTTHPGQ